MITYPCPEIVKNEQINLPSKSASHTSSLVTLSALSSIAMFWDFLGSNTLVSSSTGGRTDLLVTVSLKAEPVDLQPNRVSIMSSFNLHTTNKPALVTHHTITVTNK